MKYDPWVLVLFAVGAVIGHIIIAILKPIII